MTRHCTDVTKHTPGPWHYDRHVSRGESIFAVFCYYRDKDGVFLGSAGTQPESEANARLIAAAPDLLRELEHLVRLLEPALNDGLQVSGLATLNAARLAIAKAKGTK